MNIFYDYELMEDEFDIKITPMGLALLNELKNFIVGRLSVLSDEIKAEEFFDENDEAPYIVIRMITEPLYTVNFRRYSDRLTKRMYEGFSQNDLLYIDKKLREIYNSFLN